MKHIFIKKEGHTMFMNRRIILVVVWVIVIVFAFSTLFSMLVWGEEGAAPEDSWTIITISAAGDVTLGKDAKAPYANSIENEVANQKSNYSYFMKNVKPIFERDDLTLVNLEAPFTTSTMMADKQFRFKAHPPYTEILKQGSIEAVNLANNHMFDYLDQGYWDTVSTLSSADIGYFGYQHQYLKEIKGIKIGMAGFTGWENSKQKKNEIKKAIDSLRAQGADLVIASFHWGEEGQYLPTEIQKDLGHYCIDIGVDLVLGHHPHVIQGIQLYKGKSIVYSMGNFCFGGNKNPKDKDAFIYQHSFGFKDKVLQAGAGQVIPISVSSVKNRNSYQPTPLTGSELDRVMNKIRDYSLQLNP
jgi:poly-gamma-glutamate capsule biosynthesis protein CapA/YwtB (metallophosphatase superfamily)